MSTHEDLKELSLLALLQRIKKLDKMRTDSNDEIVEKEKLFLETYDLISEKLPSIDEEEKVAVTKNSLEIQEAWEYFRTKVSTFSEITNFPAKEIRDRFKKVMGIPITQDREVVYRPKKRARTY